jgi:hypothetical protein
MKISKDWVLAGRAVFTIQQPAGAPEKPHYTFKVKRVEPNGQWPEAFFVKLLTRPNNQTDFTYIGKLTKATGQTKTTGKSVKFEGSYPLRLLNRTLARVWANDNVAFEKHGYHVHHEGRCARCGKPLTVPESIETGFGPECSKILGLVASPNGETDMALEFKADGKVYKGFQRLTPFEPYFSNANYIIIVSNEDVIETWVLPDDPKQVYLAKRELQRYYDDYAPGNVSIAECPVYKRIA